ncbi:MAG: hypothetical protein JWM42_1173 [Burkholderia sp.]|nr:hypothetical protein [Burkholderia sp.]
MFRIVSVLLFSAGLSACTQIQEAFMPADVKVNMAFPPSVEVKMAQENLRALLQADADATKVLDEQYASRLQLRALTCLEGRSVGRFTSVNGVKALPLNRDCFVTQDAQLLQYLGIRQVGARLAQQPLRPLKRLGPPTEASHAGMPETASGVAASSAGVVVLQGTRGELTSIEIPGGKKIASLSVAENPSHSIAISPNGRIAAVDTRNRSVTFIDTETGTKLWEAKGIHRLLAWVPEAGAVVVTEGSSSNLAIVDTQSGKVAPHPVSLRYPSWALPVSGSPSHTLIGSSREFTLVEHTRTSEGIKATALKDFRITQGSGVTSSTPTLMLDGKSIVFITSRDIISIDLASGKETLWQTGTFLSNRYAKLGENKLLIDSYEAGGIGTKPMVFDITQSTLAPVESQSAISGIVYELAGRTGFMRRGSNRLWFGDELKAGEPASLDTLIAEHNLRVQLAKLEAQTRMEERSNGQGADAFPPGVPMAARAPMAPVAQSAPMLSDIPADAQVHMVGVYQGRSRDVSVSVRSGPRPVVLVLASYEPVRWNVSNQGARIAAVLVAGYNPSTVNGTGNARVLRIGSNYAYKIDSPEYQQLVALVSRYTSAPIRSFQGLYSGSEFSVGP